MRPQTPPTYRLCRDCTQRLAIAPTNPCGPFSDAENRLARPPSRSPNFVCAAARHGPSSINNQSAEGLVALSDDRLSAITSHSHEPTGIDRNLSRAAGPSQLTTTGRGQTADLRTAPLPATFDQIPLNRRIPKNRKPWSGASNPPHRRHPSCKILLQKRLRRNGDPRDGRALAGISAVHFTKAAGWRIAKQRSVLSPPGHLPADASGTSIRVPCRGWSPPALRRGRGRSAD